MLKWIDMDVINVSAVIIFIAYGMLPEARLPEGLSGLAPIFPYTFYHLTHYWFAAADIPVANDTPVHYADAIRCNVR
ncbi:hypothetical protein J9A24_25870, partial [Klebsiella pneumoniae]